MWLKSWNLISKQYAKGTLMKKSKFNMSDSGGSLRNHVNHRYTSWSKRGVFRSKRTRFGVCPGVGIVQDDVVP